MKAIRFYLVLLFLLTGPKLFSQVRLSITSLDGFPNALGDTAYNNASYDSIFITIKNTGNIAFQGEADVMIQGGLGLTDTLYMDSIGSTILAPNDSIVKRPPPYLFNSVNYIDGDNIVVVWPQARVSGILSDTISFIVYYVSFQSINGPERKALQISPNPGTDFIRLGISEIKQLEYVRIFSFEGRLIYEADKDMEMIRVKNWPAGIYFIEVQGKTEKYSGRVIIQ